MEELAGRTNLEIIREDIEAITVVRVPDTPPHAQVQRYLLNELQSHLYWKVETHRFTDTTPLGEKEFTNIIATWSPLPKSNPRFALPENERRIVLAAHYDSKLFDFEFVAATDSAVPCALLLDLVRTLDQEAEHYATHRSAKINPQLSLQIVLFDGEEAFVDWTDTDSIYGARALAAKWKEDDRKFHEKQDAGNAFTDEEIQARKSSGLENIELFVLLDLLGANDPIPQFFSYFAETKEAFMKMSNVERRLSRSGLLDLSNIPQVREQNPYLSPGTLTRQYQVSDDHLPFLQGGVPVVHLIPYGFPRVWHSAGDNLSAVDFVQVKNWSTFFRVWVAEYLNFV